ncbi:MAG: hypothetical protein MZV64_29740 [Ignavibacteriales bacterium]|nr:hypothetical protein [Ignavibacteriales bacterium]
MEFHTGKVKLAPFGSIAAASSGIQVSVPPKIPSSFLSQRERRGPDDAPRRGPG